ncbi:MAG: DUF5689 domain-containing protein [Sphingobacteriia bacterium]|jgi:hypothetical protein
MKNSLTYISWALLLLSIFLWPSCYKKLDEPPLYAGTMIQATQSIRTMRAAHIPGNFEKLSDNQIITGIVIANDATDNFYKTIVIQDSTGGISVRLDGFGLATDYPIGQRLFIRLNGLWLGEYGGMLQLGGSVDYADPSFPEIIPIPTPLFSKYILVGNKEAVPAPIKVRFEQLKDSMQSRLVQIDSIELVASDTAKSFGDAINKATVSHTLTICNGGTIYLRTSGFAKFAALKTPRGNGTITGIYTIFGSQKQLVVRDTSDLSMNNLRCSNGGPKQLFYEDFESIPVNTNLTINGWKNIPETGGKYFTGKITGGNRYAEISAFASNQPLISSWLILPPINLNNSSNEQLSFLTKDAFDNGASLQVFISSNYDGSNTPWKARWTLLKTIVSKGNINGIAPKWTESGKISLTGYTNTIYIVFKYDGNDLPNAVNMRTTAFQLDEIKIMGN